MKIQSGADVDYNEVHCFYSDGRICDPAYKIYDIEEGIRAYHINECFFLIAGDFKEITQRDIFDVTLDSFVIYLVAKLSEEEGCLDFLPTLRKYISLGMLKGIKYSSMILQSLLKFLSSDVELIKRAAFLCIMEGFKNGIWRQDSCESSLRRLVISLGTISIDKKNIDPWRLSYEKIILYSIYEELEVEENKDLTDHLLIVKNEPYKRCAVLPWSIFLESDNLAFTRPTSLLRMQSAIAAGLEPIMHELSKLKDDSITFTEETIIPAFFWEDLCGIYSNGEHDRGTRFDVLDILTNLIQRGFAAHSWIINISLNQVILQGLEDFSQQLYFEENLDTLLAFMKSGVLCNRVDIDFNQIKKKVSDFKSSGVWNEACKSILNALKAEVKS